MGQQLLVAIAAGLAAALLYWSVLSGSPFSIVLFYLASLPLFIAGLGWGWISAAIGAAAGTLALTIFGGLIPGGIFLIAVAAPAAFLSRLAMLSRPTGPDGDLEWYPVGRIIAACALIGAGLILPSLASFGFSLERLHIAVRSMFDAMIAANQGTAGVPAASEVDTDALAALFVRLMPPMSVVIWITTTLISLYLAGRILRAAKKLSRPWPDLHAIELPRVLALGTGGALAATFLPGILGVVATAVAAALLFAHMLVGLAVMHVTTLPSPVRILILGGVYFVILFVGWSRLFINLPGIVLAIIGLLEPTLNLRQRALTRIRNMKNRRPPPPSGGTGNE